jgi:hypothetical protein
MADNTTSDKQINLTIAETALVDGQKALEEATRLHVAAEKELTALPPAVSDFDKYACAVYRAERGDYGDDGGYDSDEYQDELDAEEEAERNACERKVDDAIIKMENLELEVELLIDEVEYAKREIARQISDGST